MSDTFETIVEHFGSKAKLGARFGATRQTAHKWIRRRRIPPRLWAEIAQEVPGVTLATLHFAHLHQAAEIQPKEGA